MGSLGMSEESGLNKGFRFEDKRKLGREGEEKNPHSQKEPTRDEVFYESPLRKEEGGAPVSLINFLISLHASALLHLGKLPDPKTGLYTHDLLLSKQTIDILGMLEEKTRGNLTEDEASLFNHILYELRLEFVKTTKTPKGS
jgi:hypothetical protein